MFDSERNKQHQRVLCKEIRRLPNETIKQLAVRIETLVRKAYSLNTHDYKITKMTEILMMTLTPQLRKIAIKKRASHHSSLREPDLDFSKLVDKLEQAEITMKLEETENLKLQYVNHIETKTTHNNIQETDIDLSEKITEILNIYEKNPNWKGKPSFKKWCNYCRRYGHIISECRQKQQDNQNKPSEHKEPNKSFYQFMKKDQNLPNKNVYSNNSSGKPLPNSQNYSGNQSPHNSSYRGRSHEQRNSRNFSQNRYSRSNSRNSYPRSNSNSMQKQISSYQPNRNRNYSNNQSRNSSYDRNRHYSNNRNRNYSNNRNRSYSNNRNNYPNIKSRNNSYKRSNYQRSHNNQYNISRNNSQNRNSSYNNRYRNYSQSPHRNNNGYHNSQYRHRSNTPKHQRQINQVQTNEEITSDPQVSITQKISNYK